ncbi:hypothetical protein FXF51_60295, partial [Nonomuraea sp. PA05]|uniref:condensation domain-containing protein n=1 Tax=Nonomuraea sp. PA05 TaxID=2604466 RepID=UPI0011D54CBA
CQTGDDLLAALDHQDTPYEQVVAAVNPPRHPHRNPLFDVLFTVDRVPELMGGTPLLFDRSLSLTDYMVSLVQAGDDLHLQVVFAEDLFSREWAESFTDALLTLLSAAVAAPDTPVSRLPLCAPAPQAALPPA